MKFLNQTTIATVVCFIFFLLFYGITARSEIQVSDEAATFAAGISLATQGDLAIDELQWLQDRVNIGQKGRDDHLYAKYFLGNVLSTALIYKFAEKHPDAAYYWNGKEFAPSLTTTRLILKLNALWGALAMTALLLTVRRYFTWKTAITVVIAIGIGSDWWYQSRGFFSEIGAGSFLMLCLYFTTSDTPYLSSLALALSLLFRPTNLLGISIWGKSLFKRPWIQWLSVVFIVLGICAIGYYNWYRFASPFDFGYGTEEFNAAPLDGLYGILFSPGRSIFIYSPILLLAIGGGYFFYKKEPLLTASCLVTIFGYIVAVGTWHSWFGGWSWGSRLLTPIVPLLGFLTAPIIEKAWQNKWGLGVVGLLIVAGASIQIMALMLDPLHVMIELVSTGQVPFEDTLYTLHNSWIAMQWRALQNWNWCMIDSLTLKQWWGGCLP